MAGSPKHQGNTVSPSLSLQASKWQFVGQTQPIRASNLPNGALAFEFPAVNFVPFTNQGSVNYLWQAVTGSIWGKTSLSMTVSVVTVGAPAFNYQLEPGNTCPYPAHVRFVIGESGSALWGDQYGRWWSHDVAVQLQQGMFVATVPLTPDQWSSVYGVVGNYDAASLAGFQTALSNVGELGVTFGGGCFFGHGVNVSGGTAQFQLLGFGVQ